MIDGLLILSMGIVIGGLIVILWMLIDEAVEIEKEQAQARSDADELFYINRFTDILVKKLEKARDKKK